jgi:glucosylceramidase
MNRALLSISSLGLAVLLAACSSSGTNEGGGSGGSQSSGSGGSESGGSGGNESGGSGGSEKGGSGGNQGGQGGSEKGGSGGNQGGQGGSEKGGSGGSAGSGGSQGGSGGTTVKGGTTGSTNGGTTGTGNGGSTGTGKGGATTSAGGTTTQNGGTTGAGGGQTTGGTTGAGTGGATTASTALVTSASGSYWKTGTWTEAASGTADVTVNDGSASQTWEGFGGAFNEMGWNQLSSKALQDEAIGLLFGDEGCRFAWGRIPMGASDYGMSRYTLDDTGTDVTPDSSEGNRPAADTSLSKFSLARDGEKLIPYIKAALAVKPDIRFWASPWTPPVWMKTGYKKDVSYPSTGNAKKPSYFDGGTMKSDAAILTAYAEYYKKFVTGYKDQGIKVEIVSPQNEPGYDLNYPSCLWDKSTYVTFIGKYLGPAMKDLGVTVMAGTLSNETAGKDIDSAQAAIADGTAKPFLSVVGVQWGVLDKVNSGTSFSGLPIWASETKCGNYPWQTSAAAGPPAIAAFNSSKAPNDQSYGVEQWYYIRDAITKGKVVAYNAWNMVLDSVGKNIDTSRDWPQDALLAVSGGAIQKTPAYYVYRHFSQFVDPKAKVVGTSGGDAVAFKNPDNSLVAVMYSKTAKSNYIVKIGGKLLQFSMPADGWATVKFK